MNQEEMIVLKEENSKLRDKLGECSQIIESLKRENERLTLLKKHTTRELDRLGNFEEYVLNNNVNKKKRKFHLRSCSYYVNPSSDNWELTAYSGPS
jgi:hypothetical protein